MFLTEFKNKSKYWKLLLPLVLILVTGLVGSVVAWTSSSTTVENPMHTDYDVILYDKYTADNLSWSLGEAVNKSVYVTNEGKSNAFLRMYYTEIWQEAVAGGTYNTAVIDGKDTVIKNWASSGFLNADGSVNSTYWTYNPADGYYYYNYILKPSETVEILDSFALNLETAGFVTSASSGNTTNKFLYNLDFVKESIQATTSACSDLWGLNPAIDAGTGKVTWQF